MEKQKTKQKMEKLQKEHEINITKSFTALSITNLLIKSQEASTFNVLVNKKVAISITKVY